MNKFAVTGYCLVVSIIMVVSLIIVIPFIIMPDKTNSNQSTIIDQQCITIDSQNILIDHQGKIIISITKDKEELLIKINDLLIKSDELVVSNNILRLTIRDKDELATNLKKELYLKTTIIELMRDEIDSLKNQRDNIPAL